MLNLDRNTPVVDQSGKPLQKLQIFGEQCNALEILSGVGSPESVVEAKKLKQYMNETTGELYIKRVDSIAGDKSVGWHLVG